MKTEHQDKFLQITKQQTIPFVTVGVASDVAGHVISEDAAIAMIEAVEAGEVAQATLATVQTELATANSTLATAQAAATAAQTELATANTDLATAQARIVVLEAQDGGGFSSAKSDKADAEGTALATEFKMSADDELKQLTQ
jgi:hypothetical protein